MSCYNFCYIYICMHTCMCAMTFMWMSDGNLQGIGSLHLSCRSWGSNLGFLAWQQAYSPTDWAILQAIRAIVLKQTLSSNIPGRHLGQCSQAGELHSKEPKKSLSATISGTVPLLPHPYLPEASLFSSSWNFNQHFLKATEKKMSILLISIVLF